MTATITPEQQAAIAAYLKDRHIPANLGTKDEACSIAAINLALSGQLTDEIPECMSAVIGCWIIVVQDAMPDEMRNGPEWRRLLPLAAGTGREQEDERLAIIVDWMWGTVLPVAQSEADKHGFGAEWRRMIEERTEEAAYAAWSASNILRLSWAADAAVSVAYGLNEDTEAEDTAKAAAQVMARVVIDDAVSAVAITAATWELFDPPALLEKLITLDRGTK